MSPTKRGERFAFCPLPAVRQGMDYDTRIVARELDAPLLRRAASPRCQWDVALRLSDAARAAVPAAGALVIEHARGELGRYSWVDHRRGT